jgi:diguanylate cyclase (GGDEF)-like protein
MAVRSRRIEERRLESVLEITRDILRAPDLDFALESIARGVAEVFGFKYVTIVIAEDDSDVMLRRVLHGFPPEIVLERRNEEISRAAMLALLEKRFESAENCFYLPAEAEADWERSIYTGALPRDAPRATPEAWHERDSLCLVLRDEYGTMIGYMSPDAPLDGCIPDPAELHAMELFVNLMGLALAKARAQERLRHEATHDALTGLANRSYFQEQLELALDHLRSAPDRASALLFFDLDDFKEINDTLGHLAGDAMLRVVADRLEGAVRSSDVVARIGGDEFAVLLNDRADAGAVDATVARIQETLVAPVSLDGRIVYITASVGIALLEAGDERIEDVLRTSSNTCSTRRNAASRFPAACARRSIRTSSASNTSRSCGSATARSPASKRWYGGTTPIAVRSSRSSSSRSRKRSGSSSRSAASSSRKRPPHYARGTIRPASAACACT